MIRKLQLFGHQLHLIALMMQVELVSETSEFINHLTRLSARENVIEFCRRGKPRDIPIQIQNLTTLNTVLYILLPSSAPNGQACL